MSTQSGCWPAASMGSSIKPDMAPSVPSSVVANGIMMIHIKIRIGRPKDLQ